MLNLQEEGPGPKPAPIALTSNFHAGENFHAGNFHIGQLTSYATENFHAGRIDTKPNFHTVPSNFHAGENFHAGTLRTKEESEKGSNFHSGNFHIGQLKSYATENFHAGHAEQIDTKFNFHTGQPNFHAGDRTIDLNFHTGAIIHAGNFHAGGKAEAANFHAGDTSKAPNMQVGLNAKKNFHAGFPNPLSQKDYDISNVINFYAGQSSGLVDPCQSTRSQTTSEVKGFETTLSFYASTFDGKPGFNHVEKPVNGIYSNVTTSSHQLLVTDIRSSEDQLSLDRDAVLTISNIPDHGHTFTDDANVIKDFYPEVEKLLLEHVPGAQRVFIFDHTIRRKFGDRGPVLRAHIDQTPASALARVTRHLPDEAAALTKGRFRLINFWRPINGTVENYPLAFALSGSVPDTELKPVKHHYPTWTGETYGVGYSEGQNWCYWSKMGNSDALLLQCFDSEKGGRLAHSAVVDPTSTSQKYRESIEVRALVFG